MNYRAVGKRCAVVLESLRIPVTPAEALKILRGKHFSILDVDIIKIARSQIGIAEYQLDARPSQAPKIVNCSAFTKWLLAQRGCWIPQYAIEQREHGQTVHKNELKEGDLVFTGGRFGFYHDVEEDKVSHVGIVTAQDTVIHAERKAGGVVEIPLEIFFAKKRFRGARRCFPSDQNVLTLAVPDAIEIETAKDIQYLIRREHALRERSTSSK